MTFESVSVSLFRPRPAELFGANGAVFAAGTIATNGSSLDYNTSNDTYPIDNVEMRDWLLAKAFPSRTGPLGSRPVSDKIGGDWKKVNFDMSSGDFKNSTSGFPSEGGTEWHHNDIREAPYLYVHRLFDRLTGKEVSQ